MAISHKDHDHPNTPAARAKCRKEGTPGPQIGTNLGRVERAYAEQAGLVKHDAKTCQVHLCPTCFPQPAQSTVVPRKRHDGGVVKGLKESAPVKVMKAPAGKPIKGPADVPVDCPAPLHYAIKAAWSRGWGVIEGYKLKDDENRILIGGTVAQVSIVWTAEGRTGVFVRKLSSSITHRADSAQAAIGLASGDDEWPWTN